MIIEETVSDLTMFIDSITNYTDILDNDKTFENKSLTFDFSNSSDAYNNKFWEDIKKDTRIREEINNVFYYRGVDSEKYLLAPGIYRKDEHKSEYFYFHEMCVHCSGQLSALTSIDKLVFMQHYSCPTRLLDITENPLVALYFACLNSKCQDDGAVYIFGLNSNNVLYSQSDRVQMLSKLSEFTSEEQAKLKDLAFRDLDKDKFIRSTHDKYKDDLIERFYHSVKQNNPAFERGIKPIDLLRPQFLKAERNNQRILKQEGAFIMSGLCDDENDCDKKIRNFVVKKYIIKKKDKDNILMQLAHIGINQATLFPEADKVAEYLKRL